MKLPIQFALTYPEREQSTVEPLDFTKYPKLTFFEPDLETFGCLRLALESMKEGGTMPLCLNAANEVAVSAFLNRKIGFYDITESVCEVCERLSGAKDVKSLEAILGYDKEARILAKEVLGL